jgi:hypothetical protein
MFQTKKIAAIGIVLLSLSTASSAVAGVTESVGTWEGSGAVFGADGKQLSTYTAEMISTAVGSNEVKSQITVTMSDGTQKVVNRTMTDTAQGFSLISDDGDGGGYCLGDGLCLAYITSNDGHSYSTTIVIDSSSQERFLTTELQNGKP